MLICIHATEGLCRACQAALDEDPASYIEHGDHPKGLKRWHELQEEIAAWAAEVRERTPEEEAELPW